MYLETKDLLMSASNRGFRGKSTNFSGRAAGFTDSHGNRKTFDEVRVPPDNIGNKVDQDLIADFIHDGLGNCLEEEPSHFKSGILAAIVGGDKKNEQRRRKSEQNYMPSGDAQFLKPNVKLAPARPAQAPLPRLHKTTPDLLGDQYIAKLNDDFAKLLNQKAGLGFSFSMKTTDDSESSEEEIAQELLKVKKLITLILESNKIKVKVGLSEYRTAVHHFAVYFIGPEQDDPARSKEMIAALRQVVSEYSQKMVKASVNIFLVLANAQSVIEEHLLKIGAKKVE